MGELVKFEIIRPLQLFRSVCIPRLWNMIRYISLECSENLMKEYWAL